jgi:hypothetical protein
MHPPSSSTGSSLGTGIKFCVCPFQDFSCPSLAAADFLEPVPRENARGPWACPFVLSWRRRGGGPLGIGSRGVEGRPGG